MLIRSQDKKNLINKDLSTNIAITTRDGKFNIMCYYASEDAYDKIGIYSTEPKAIKVLDMIQKHADYLRITSLGGGNVHEIGETFQMPSDEEGAVKDE